MNKYLILNKDDLVVTDNSMAKINSKLTSEYSEQLLIVPSAKDMILDIFKGPENEKDFSESVFLHKGVYLPKNRPENGEQTRFIVTKDILVTNKYQHIPCIVTNSLRALSSEVFIQLRWMAQNFYLSRLEVI